jgi:hypothetical protein
MRKRFLLSNDAGVRWEAGDGRQALFAFREFAFPVPAGTPVAEIANGVATPVTVTDGIFQARPRSAYRIG